MGSGRLRRALAALLGLWALGGPAALAQDGPPGITEPTVFPPFDPNTPGCAPPPGLEKVLGFAQDNQRQFMQGVSRGLQLAARHRGLQFRLAQANNDGARMIEQVQAMRRDRVGALVAAPVDAASLKRSLQQMIWSGAYVGTVVPPPAIELLNAPQYETGRVLGEAAAAYIRDRLRGRANVVLLTHDSLPYLAARFVAIRHALKDMPGITVVADISPRTVNKQGGYETMRTVLLAHPSVDVVLGADTVVLGALQALREAGKASDGQFLGGIDGEPEAIAEIRRGGPYKVSVSLNSPVFAYAMGQHAADWLAGRSIPQAMDTLPVALSQANLAQYEADFADPASVWRDTARRAAYLRMYGNICHDSRGRYVNFPWSSERR
ncbi:MAG: sugar ABC transporter substrate-binding protein [Reyranellaceae bacterium]